MKKTLFYITLLLTIPVHGQLYLRNDTVKIKEVFITGNKNHDDLSGFKKVAIDSSVLMNYSQSTVAELLSDNTTIFIKSYGMGGTATPSFRGTGANQTQIAWNGINIDHPMLGQSDLSLLPSGMIDDIQIYYGGASMVLNSGGIGGIINLETKPVWKQGTDFSLNPGAGSFGRYSGLFSLKSGTFKFQSITKVFFQSAENNFRFLNNELAQPEWETRQNSQVHQKGFIQELYFKKSENVVSARIWYQSANRNLPSTLLTQQTGSNENQFDESIRTMLNYDINKSTAKYFVTGAWLMDRLNYNNQLVSIASRNLSDMMTIKAGMDRRIFHNTNLKIVLSDDLNGIKSNNYSHYVNRNTISLTSSAEYKGVNRFTASLLIREIMDKNKLLIPDFSVGAQLRIFDLKEYFLKANLSRNSKIPTMNDLFWFPGGNPDLKNEYAFIYELTYEMSQKISVPLTLKYDLSVFRNTINDMIQWHPGVYTYWIADNIRNVNSTGLESALTLNYRNNNITSVLTARYSFTKAIDVSSTEGVDDAVGKQLTYTPENQLNTSLRFCYKNIYSTWIASLTGRRYTTADNSEFLPAYFLNSITTGVRLHIKRDLFDINFNIDNLFNVNYQTIAYYPLPGRSYFLKVLFQFVK